MSLSDVLERLQETPVALAISSGTPWRHLFPAIETVHVLCLTLTVGSIVMVDLRLLGLTSHDSSVSKLTREVLPWTWVAFLMSAIAGSFLFIYKAESYFFTTQFQLKFLCMFLAFINMVVFHLGVYRRVIEWDSQIPPPLAARLAGALSLGLWIAVIVFGRWVGFTGFSA
jgi:putative copper export protein